MPNFGEERKSRIELTMTTGQFRQLLTLVSNKSRTVHTVANSEDEEEQLDALLLEMNGSE